MFKRFLIVLTLVTGCFAIFVPPAGASDCENNGMTIHYMCPPGTGGGSGCVTVSHDGVSGSGGCVTIGRRS